MLDLGDRQVVRVGLRAVLIKHETDLAAFDRAFDLVFADGAGCPVANGPERCSGRRRWDRSPRRSLAVDVATAADGR